MIWITQRRQKIHINIIVYRRRWRRRLLHTAAANGIWEYIQLYKMKSMFCGARARDTQVTTTKLINLITSHWDTYQMIYTGRVSSTFFSTFFLALYCFMHNDEIIRLFFLLSVYVCVVYSIWTFFFTVLSNLLRFCLYNVVPFSVWARCDAKNDRNKCRYIYDSFLFYLLGTVYTAQDRNGDEDGEREIGNEYTTRQALIVFSFESYMKYVTVP